MDAHHLSNGVGFTIQARDGVRGLTSHPNRICGHSHPVWCAGDVESGSGEIFAMSPFSLSIPVAF